MRRHFEQAKAVFIKGKPKTDLPFYILLFFTVHTISTDVLLNMLIIYILYKAPHDTLHPLRPSLHPNNVCSSEEYS